MVLLNRILLTFVVYFLLTSAFAIEESGADTVASFNLTHHIVGYLSILLSVSGYVAAMSEEVIHLRKSKPMLLGSALVWFAICIVYTVHGQEDCRSRFREQFTCLCRTFTVYLGFHDVS